MYLKRIPTLLALVDMIDIFGILQQQIQKVKEKSAQPRERARAGHIHSAEHNNICTKAV